MVRTKLSRSLDLSAGSKANFVISYEFSQDNGSTWEKAERSDETVFSKDKSWDGYLNSKDGVKYPGKIMVEISYRRGS